MKKIILLSLVFLVGCTTTGESQSKISRKPFDITATQKRINTAECNDVDDWYLEGFRVGKSYHNHKQKMLNQRISYCSTKGKVAKKYRNAWEDGFRTAKRR